MFIVSLCGIFRRAIKLRTVPAAIGLALLSSVLPGAFGGMLLWGLAYLFGQLQFGDAGKWHALAWGPPVLVGVFSLVVVLHLGLVGIAFPDSGREWWSRLGAWLCIYSLRLAWTGHPVDLWPAAARAGSEGRCRGQPDVGGDNDRRIMGGAKRR